MAGLLTPCPGGRDGDRGHWWLDQELQGRAMGTTCLPVLAASSWAMGLSFQGVQRNAFTEKKMQENTQEWHEKYLAGGWGSCFRGWIPWLFGECKWGK